MGIKQKPRTKRTRRAPKTEGLADALFTTSQQRVLGLLFGQPDRSFFASELIALAGGGSGAVQRELASLSQVGLITVRKIGAQKHFQANPDSPLFEELCSIARKTVGLREPLQAALAPFAARLTAAFVFGSVAKRSDTVLSDIDLMLISTSLTHSEVFMALAEVSHRLGRTVNPTLMTPEEFAQGLAAGKAFHTRLREQPKLWIFGDENALAA